MAPGVSVISKRRHPINPYRWRERVDEFVRKLDKKLAEPWPTRISLRHMKGIILVAATAIVLSALLAVNSAAGNDNAPQNGEDLERECDSQLGSVSLSYCNGFIAGVGQAIQLEAGAKRICVPSEATVEQATQVVQKYLNDHPESLHLAGALLGKRALTKAWPCPVKMR
jgi:hypothetical protein